MGTQPKPQPLKKDYPFKKDIFLLSSYNLDKLKYSPRWIILLIDISIVLFSSLITLLTFNNLSIGFIHPQTLYNTVLYNTSVNIFFFLALRTYSGVIRHTSLIDAVKLFFSQFLTFGVIVTINYFFTTFGKHKTAIFTAAFFHAFVSLGILIFFRITIKYLFEKLIHDRENKNLTNIIVYGIDVNALSIAKALISESPKRFNVKGFVDKTNENNTKRLLNLPIYRIKKTIPLTLRMAGAEAIILAENTLSLEERNAIVENCIQYNFKVFMAPLISNLDNQNDLAKQIKPFEITDLLERKPIVLDTKANKLKLNKKTILITGGAGSIGSEIVRQIFNYNPDKIIIVDQAETPLHDLILEIKSLQKNLTIQTIIADVRNAEIMEQILSTTKPNIIFHAAAYKHVPLMEENQNQAILTNVMGTKIVADLSVKYEVEDFIMISTDKAVNPTSIMGASKRIAEMYIQSVHYNMANSEIKTRTKFMITRFGNVLGSNGSVVPLFKEQIRNGGPVTVTHPEVIRYFMTIPEACQLVLEACSMGNGGEIFIFDMGDPVKIVDLAKKMIRLAGFKPDIDIKIKITGIRPGEKLFEELLTKSAKNLPTHHEKILIAIEDCFYYDTLNEKINVLIENAHSNNLNEILTSINSLVPEYKSTTQKATSKKLQF